MLPVLRLASGSSTSWWSEQYRGGRSLPSHNWRQRWSRNVSLLHYRSAVELPQDIYVWFKTQVDCPRLQLYIGDLEVCVLVLHWFKTLRNGRFKIRSPCAVHLPLPLSPSLDFFFSNQRALHAVIEFEIFSSRNLLSSSVICVSSFVGVQCCLTTCCSFRLWHCCCLVRIWPEISH